MPPLKNMILVSIPIFYVLESMVLSSTSHDAPFNCKFNMAVVKPEVLITNWVVYQLEGKYSTIESGTSKNIEVDTEIMLIFFVKTDKH